ncbi:MAG: hypothetical protein HeimC2_07440 [Candidatus Heimdallarchaeota archaeon LC_2]|nr:MAG: hypothetical protein HeimC2_07440 [Candidatus Heimdallarchaeota archaeon LC_2]
MGYLAKGKLSQILNVYEIQPEGNGPFPTIINFMHAGAIDDPMKRVCDDLAAEGYYAVCADAYLNGSYNFQSKSDSLILRAFNLLLDWLKVNPLVDHDKLGLIGFCMGGRFVYLANAKMDIMKAAVAYYGFPHRGSNEADTPQNLIEQFTAPTLSLFGSKDGGIPEVAVNAYKEASEKDGLPHKTYYYEGAEHGFLDPNSPRYHEEAAKQAWEKTLEHFKKYL